MHILCPHCRNPIELVKLQPREEIFCPSCGSSFNLEAGSTTGWKPGPNEKLGKFELLDVVGAGAFGTVYKGRDPELDRSVAVKVPRSGNLAGAADFDRFIREARSVAQLRHPGIVPVHEVGQHDGVPYLVSEFVEGITLSDLLSSRRPGFRESAELIAAAADALHYAHTMGVIHRDVKPSNIMMETAVRARSVSEGPAAPTLAHASGSERMTPRLMDFGLAKRDAGEITMTIDGQVLGTPAYMSPEQARGEAHRVDARGDVYSLGVILYQLLTGELPFRGNTRMLLHQVLHDEPRRPRSLNDRIPRDLETICLKAMAKDASRRYGSAQALADDLRRFLKGEPITARPVGQAERLWRWCRRNPVVAGLSAAVAAALFVGALVSLGFALHASQKADDEKKARNDAEIEKQKAEDKEALAKVNEELANQRADETLAAVEQMQIVNGLREADAGQFFQALRWFALPLVGDGARKPRADMYRDRLSNYWRLPQDASATRFILAQSLQHQGEVNHAAFSPDGRRVVTASDDKTARVWDAATGQPAGPPLPHQGAVVHAAFSPDGRRVVTASYDQTARVWDAATGQPAGPPLQHQDIVWHAAFSPDGRRVVTASRDNSARVWDAATGQPIGPPLQHQGEVNHAAFSPDGRRIVTASFDQTARVWDAATGQPAGPPLQHQSVVRHAAFSPDGRRVVTASEDKTARVWDAATGQPAGPPLPHQGWVQHAAFSPDGRRVVTVSWDKTARVWDAATGQPAAPPLQHQDAVNHAAFSPDGRRVVTASNDKTARVWDVSTDERPAEDWVRLTQLLAGQIDRFGAHTSMRPEKLQAEWVYLRGKYPKDFTVTPAQARAWHRREAADCIKEKNPVAALFHKLHAGDIRVVLP